MKATEGKKTQTVFFFYFVFLKKILKCFRFLFLFMLMKENVFIEDKNTSTPREKNRNK